MAGAVLGAQKSRFAQQATRSVTQTSIRAQASPPVRFAWQALRLVPRRDFLWQAQHLGLTDVVRQAQAADVVQALYF